MAELYFDHNISRDVRVLLEQSGHRVLATREIGHERLPDDAQLLFAAKSGRIIVTHNRNDFQMLHDAWLTWPAAFGMSLPAHPGVLVLDQAPSTTLATVLVDFLDATAAERIANALFWWHRHDGWRQRDTGTTWIPYRPPLDAGRE